MKKVIALTVALIAALSVFARAGEHTQLAACEPGPVIIGSGSSGWRRESLAAGPVGVHKNPLAQMAPVGVRRPGELATKMPLLLEGHDPVAVSVPPALEGRVFLYYGFHPGPDGKRSTSFTDYPGDSTVDFHPCLDKPRTVWPGGIRVKGRRPVRLLVQTEGGSKPMVLRLGRPRVLHFPSGPKRAVEGGPS